jgi:hypothetical protein
MQSTSSPPTPHHLVKSWRHHRAPRRRGKRSPDSGRALPGCQAARTPAKILYGPPQTIFSAPLTRPARASDTPLYRTLRGAEIWQAAPVPGQINVVFFPALLSLTLLSRSRIRTTGVCLWPAPLGRNST